jgi:hypothetical protein
VTVPAYLVAHEPCAQRRNPPMGSVSMHGRFHPRRAAMFGNVIAVVLVELRGGGGSVMDLLVFTFMERPTSTWDIVLCSRH